jgi:hypothetical protein
MITGNSPSFLLGHIPQLLDIGPPALNAKLSEMYGPVFKVIGIDNLESCQEIGWWWLQTAGMF